jgi:hypothetical protein
MRSLPLLFIAFTLSGCATAYKPQGLSGGFSEAQLDRNVFRVSFKGNGYTSRERAEEMALLRSAELTLNSGFTHFAIINGQSYQKYSTITTPTQSTTTGSFTAVGNSAYGATTTTTTGGQSFVVEKPRTTNTILCFNGKPEGGAFVYDAKFLFDSLAIKYGVSPR